MLPKVNVVPRVHFTKLLMEVILQIDCNLVLLQFIDAMDLPFIESRWLATQVKLFTAQPKTA